MKLLSKLYENIHWFCYGYIFFISCTAESKEDLIKLICMIVFFFIICGLIIIDELKRLNKG